MGGPEFLARGLIPNKVATVPIKSGGGNSTNGKPPDTKTTAEETSSTESQQNTLTTTKITGNVASMDDLKHLVEKQNELIRQQRQEIEVLRKQMEKNVHLTQDFQSELSEIRKNWQTLSENKNGTSATSNGSSNFKSNEELAARLEALSSAYTDIQDRLYELDKSWKNNLMIYGVPCCDGEEDDPIITEEKVRKRFRAFSQLFFGQEFSHRA